MASSSSPNRGLFIVVGLIVGLILGALVGYSFSNVERTDSSQIASLQQQISNLQNQISNLQSQLENKNALISSLQQENANLQNQTTYLQNEMNRLINTTRIVQSEDYLMQTTGTFHEQMRVDFTSTYFTTLGRQIKIVARLQANQKTVATFDYASVSVDYVYSGQYITVTSHRFNFYGASWDFHNGELNDTLYLKLDSIPEELFGKVPLCIRLILSLSEPKFSSNPSFLVSYEVTLYDVYPP
jgi:regulator of replication initiation timing